MRMWIWWGVAVLGLWCWAGGVVGQTGATGGNTWKAGNGKYAMRVMETVSGGAGPGRSGRTTVQVLGLAIGADGKETQLWQWAAPSGPGSVTGGFRVVSGLVSDSGKRNVLITRTMGNPLTTAGEDIMPPQVVILDEKGQVAASVTAAAWWKAVKMYGKVTNAELPEMRFVEQEKMVEIKLTSGKTVRVNTGSGELSVQKDAPGVMVKMPAEMVKAGEAALHLMALKHPNPYVRETAYHDHDNDWTMDIAKGVFSVVIRDPTARTVTGVVTLEDEGWRVKLDEEKKLAEGWTPAGLTAEEAMAALGDMCGRWDFDAHLRACGQALKDAVPVAGGAEVKFKNATRTYLNWGVNLEGRTFRISDGWVDVFHTYDGMFGWDKQKHWTAWPLHYTYTATQGGIRGSSAVAIPEGFSPAVQAVPKEEPGK